MNTQHIAANVYVATPSYGAVVTTAYALGLLDLYEMSARYGFGVRVNFNSFDSLITRARNTMVAEFLADGRFTHLMWIDSDIGFKGEDVVRLLQADRPVVAGVYPLKNDGWPAAGLARALPAGATKADFRAMHATYPAVASSATLEPDAAGFLDALHAPTGFMLIRREVFLALIEHYPELHCRSPFVDRPEFDAGKPADFLYAFFDTGIDPVSRTYLSEDYWFCQLVQTIGITPAIDTHSNLQHQGIANYEGDLARSLAMQRSMIG
ncbi:hypothetical protein [Paraburkholderia sp. BCC1886]|uniref:hypothetical protein n=1 Tax=Paraburkholderia sp. BCC1886 TaxID=2562670 RepID=UPI0011828DBC|nr:hypothetical protein [Paraburkholderia sp. BCC1886]